MGKHEQDIKKALDYITSLKEAIDNKITNSNTNLKISINKYPEHNTIQQKITITNEHNAVLFTLTIYK